MSAKIHHLMLVSWISEKRFIGIVSQDWGGLKMVSIDRSKVPDIPPTCLFIILMLSS
jgi:hypothetical protein